MMDPDVQDLALAQGIKDSWKKQDLTNKLGIEPFVAQIIKDAAKKASENPEERTK
jgi:hypothetical protein